MARPYLPSFFGRGDDPFGSLFREVQKTFEDFSQRTPFARFSAHFVLTSCSAILLYRSGAGEGI